VRHDGIAYEAAGSGDPVVFLHGGLLDRHSWDAEFALARTSHHAVRFDAHGHGESDPADGDYAAHAVLIALLDHLGLDRVAAVGLSFGARTLVDAAILHPHRFTALMLVSPGYSGMEYTDPFVLAQHEAIDRAAAAHDVEGFVEGFLRAWVDGPHRSPADVDPAVRSHCARAARKAVAKPRGTGRLLEVGAADRLAELTMPVDVVLGTLDSTDVLAAGERIATAAPDARIHRIEGAAHSVNLDRPDAFAEVLRAFLSDRATRPRSR
jgi:pimeloyl-ACP methyl ester carboxylesterase